MKILQVNQSPEVFYDLRFSFAETPGVVFDPEVALELAEAVAQHDGGGYNHNHASNFTKVNLSIADLSAPAEVDEDDFYVTHIVLPKDTLLGAYNPNAVFAREFQRALDANEHDNRTNIPVSLGMFATVSAMSGGATAATLSENGLTTYEALISAGVGLAFNTLALGGHHAIRNIHRRIVTNAAYYNVNKIHLDKAARLAEKLDLSPVLSNS